MLHHVNIVSINAAMLLAVPLLIKLLRFLINRASRYKMGCNTNLSYMMQALTLALNYWCLVWMGLNLLLVTITVAIVFASFKWALKRWKHGPNRKRSVWMSLSECKTKWEIKTLHKFLCSETHVTFQPEDWVPNLFGSFERICFAFALIFAHCEKP